jgi:hypothetical protein
MNGVGEGMGVYNVCGEICVRCLCGGVLCVSCRDVQMMWVEWVMYIRVGEWLGGGMRGGGQEGWGAGGVRGFSSSRSICKIRLATIQKRTNPVLSFQINRILSSSTNPLLST